jgi:hypothetical protein
MSKLPALFLSLAALCNAHAEAEGNRAVSLAAQRDARGNQSIALTLSLPVGDKAWVEAGGGQTRNAQPRQRVRSTQLAAGRRWGNAQQWQTSLGASQRRAAKGLRQTDANASLDWQGERFDAGVDLLHRNARATGNERLRGPGLTLRAGARIGAARVYGASTQNRYRSRTQQAGTGGLLGNSLGLGSSPVTRDELALSRSALLGASWQFERATLAVEALQDRVLNQPGHLRTVQLKAAVDLGTDWSLAPTLGRTRDPQAGGTSFGALALTRRW